MSANIQTARQAAVKLLLEQNPAVLPVKVQRLRFSQNIMFDTMEGFCKVTNATISQLRCEGDYLRDGCTLIVSRNAKKLYLVLYNSNKSDRRLNFTLAHEVGHIILGHTCDGETEEREANAFAAELLMPRILAAELIKGLPQQWDNTQELAQAFYTSPAVAKLRLQNLAGAATLREQKLLKRYRPLLPNPLIPDII